MTYLEKYNTWLNQDNLDAAIKNELQQMNEQQKAEAFTNDIEFGTGGMRGIMGAGTNRLNIYVIRKATYGFGLYLKDKSANASAVIAYDNRHYSQEFAIETAKVLASMGITAYVAKELRPTPYLSFAVRELKATGGIMITASHNTKEYNGYKIYDADGCQLVPKEADVVVNNINNIQDPFKIVSDKNIELVKNIPANIDDEYQKMVKNVAINDLKKDLKVVYTPLHGTGSVFAPKILKDLGYDVLTVEKQMIHDPDFSSVKSANPEEKSAFDEAVKLGKETKADLLLANDPDADRLGIAPYHNGEYVLFNGNQTAAVILHYMLSQSPSLPNNGYVFGTVVSSDLPMQIAQKYGMKTKKVLTGFKFIGEQAKLIEGKGTYFYGFEESYGCLMSDRVRDKDAMQASLMACEAANYYKSLGKTLVDALEDIYQEYGYYQEGIQNIVLKGLDGQAKIQTIMTYFRENDIKIDNIITKEDYQLSKAFGKETLNIDLPKSNVIKYLLADGSWFVLRPSGTEPKLKVYFGVKALSHEKADSRLNEIKEQVLNIIAKI